MELYTGVVENRQDPLKLGRCQVRVMGLHTHDKTLIATSDLPWAYPMQPLTSAAVSGIGSTPLGPVEGTWVVVMFRDSDKQIPIIMGTIGGIPHETTTFIDKEPDSIVIKQDSTTANESVVDGSGNPVSTQSGTLQTENIVPVYNDLRPASTFDTISSDGLQFIKDKTPLKLSSQKDSDGVWKIGYGATQVGGLPVTEGMTITEDMATQALTEYINNEIIPAVKNNVRVLITQSMFDSLVSLEQGNGVGTLANSSLLKHLNTQNYLQAAAEFRNMSSVDTQAATDRRMQEKDFFLKEGIPSASGDVKKLVNENPIGTSAVQSSGNIGFSDPSGKYPLYQNEPDTNRLARHEEITKTIVYKKETSRDLGVKMANTSATWDQSPVPYNAAYPHNHVHQTESGHVVEFDDTPNCERIHTYHKSGSFTEIDSNGTRVTRIVGDNFEIFERDGFIHVMGSKSVTIDGASRVKVLNTFDLEVDGVTNINIHNDAAITVAGNVSVASKKSISLTSETLTISASTIDMNSTVNFNGDTNFSGKVSGLSIDEWVKADAHGNTISTENASISNTPALPEIEESTPEMPNIPKLTVITRSVQTSQDYETPDEGDSSAFIAARLSAGSVSKEDLSTETTKTDEAAITDKKVQAEHLQNCDVLFGMSEFPPSLALSSHFTLGHFNKNGSRKVVSQMGLTPPEIVCNLKGLADNCLEPIFDLFPHMIITSGFRRPGDVKNSSKTSRHYYGEAADIQLPGYTRQQYYDAIQKISKIVPYDQLILEYEGKTSVWIHISFKYTGNRYQAFTMNNHKTISGHGKFTLLE